MSEQKRNSLTSLGTNKKEKKSKDSSRTLRFTLALPESNEEACPEFNYRVLLSSAEKKRKSKLKEDGHVNGIDPLTEDDDDKLKEIARQFEEKYGGGGRKKHGRFEDYVDLGAGYDENDPFIDNTDAYDEIVPEEITTAHGGFYINCGALEFKEVSDQSDIEEIKDLKNRKRIRKPKIPDKKNDAIKKRKFVSHEREILKKRKKRAIDDLMKKKSVTVKDLLREKRESLQVPPPPPPPPPVVEQVPEPKKIVVNSVPKPTNTSITDVIESVVSAARAEEDLSKDSSSVVSKSATGSAVTTDTEESRDAEVEEKEKATPKEEVKLPDNLADDVRELIVALKKAATSSAEGKCKFFSAEVNNMLLTVEQKCQVLPCNSRQLVYSHLASYLPCTKDTLMKRAKKLILLAEEVKLKEPLKKLEAAINKIMPVLMEKFSRDCQKVAEENPQMYMELCRYYWSIDESPSSLSDGENNEKTAENNKVPSNKPKIPRRWFPWTAELRGLLCDVVRIKRLCLELKKSRKESADEVLRSFLEQEVKPLWPPGWMKVTTLFRESRATHTNAVVKPRKTPAAKKLNLVAPQGTPAGISSVVISSVTPNSLNTTARPSKNIPASAANPASVTASVPPRTKCPPTSVSTPIHVPSSVTVTVSSNSANSSANIRASPSVPNAGKLTVPSSSVPPVRTKVSSDVSMKPVGASTKLGSNILPEKHIMSGSASKVKNSVERVPAKGLDLTLSGTNKSASNAVSSNSNKVKNSSEISIIPMTAQSNVSSSVSSQKSPVASLPLINIPDCISVTPSLPSPVQTPTATTNPKPMSLKQRILYDTAKDRANSSVNINLSSQSSKLDEEGIEVIEIVGDIKSGNQKQRNALHEVSGKPKTEVRRRKKVESSKEPEIITPPVEPIPEERKSTVPPISEKEAERRLNEETAAATDYLSQIINESLTDFPNSGSSREVYQHEEKSAPRNRSVIQKPVSPPPLPIRREVKVSHPVREDTERTKDVDSEQKNEIPQSADAEESVQLEVDRVMKELIELQGHMSGEKTSDITDAKYSPPKISSSITVVPINSVVNSRNQQQMKSVKEPDVTCKPVQHPRRLSAGTEFAAAVKSSHGFQEEFQKHLFQDLPRDFEPPGFKLGKNKAIYSTINPVPKSNPSAPPEDSSNHGRSTINNSQPRSCTDSNSSSLYPKHASLNVNPTNAVRRVPISHLQDVKSNVHSTQPGVHPSLTPCDDQFSLPPLMLNFNHTFSGSTQHSPPY